MFINALIFYYLTTYKQLFLNYSYGLYVYLYICVFMYKLQIHIYTNLYLTP